MFLDKSDRRSMPLEKERQSGKSRIKFYCYLSVFKHRKKRLDIQWFWGKAGTNNIVRSCHTLNAFTRNICMGLIWPKTYCFTTVQLHIVKKKCCYCTHISWILTLQSECQLFFNRQLPFLVQRRRKYGNWKKKNKKLVMQSRWTWWIMMTSVILTIKTTMFLYHFKFLDKS